MKKQYSLQRLLGLTLIELMVVVAVVAILVSVAIPSYNNHVMKSRRAAASACLMERAQFMERHYTTNLTYVGAPEPAQCADIANFYTVSYATNPTARAYTLQAAPKGAQLRDTQCGTLSLTSAGQRGSADTTGMARCW